MHLFYLFINLRRACAARVTVVGLCVCIHSKSAASHIEITKERYQLIHRNTGTILNFCDFPKNASFKSYGIICSPPARRCSAIFFHEISFYASL